ncbi:hypothetical protein NEHOM01_0284 [Nematocida homosporus]|uniref:uncharacterized protein n=1 Tax=Nematocida homosporus TaxID=1912981 RepID=UPI00222114CF|nr:uncharacterized protein NEHOM01_0284 [Nematocida homosporus]KAI5184609.1 hypothetical protein NEHOM01_0284 [Nematocida homosporus]
MQLRHMVQSYMDKCVAYPKERWSAFGIATLLFLFRVVKTGGYRLVTYCLFLYLLHCFIGFCTPVDSDIPDPFDIEDASAVVESPLRRSGDESKPFIRRLPEFDYWLLSMQSVVGAFVATFIPFFNIPVYTPILVIYFVGLLYLTVVKIRQHMEKYKYNPFFNAKKIYKGLVQTK